jgi:hypothetical protein
MRVVVELNCTPQTVVDKLLADLVQQVPGAVCTPFEGVRGGLRSAPLTTQLLFPHLYAIDTTCLIMEAGEAALLSAVKFLHENLDRERLLSIESLGLADVSDLAQNPDLVRGYLAVQIPPYVVFDEAERDATGATPTHTED